jgi:hypothetical protein
LDDTIEKLLKTVRPHVTDDEFSHTESVCREFAAGSGKRLQALLEERASESKNWVRCVAVRFVAGLVALHARNRGMLRMRISRNAVVPTPLCGGGSPL